MKLSERIQRLRKARGLSQEELAGEMGVSRQSVSKWESGQSVPDVDKIIALSDFFGVSTDYLLKGEEAVPTSPQTQSVPEPRRAPKAQTFLMLSTAVNAASLLLGWALWHEYQNALCLAAELIGLMAGCCLFAVGMLGAEEQERKEAIRRFAKIDGALLLYPPIVLLNNLFSFGMFAASPFIEFWGPMELVIFLVTYCGTYAAVQFLVRDWLASSTED